jgi:hypothetical protein
LNYSNYSYYNYYRIYGIDGRWKGKGQMVKVQAETLRTKDREKLGRWVEKSEKPNG